MNTAMVPDSVSVRSVLAHGGRFDLRLSGDGTAQVFLATNAPIDAVCEELDAAHAALNAAAAARVVEVAS